MKDEKNALPDSRHVKINEQKHDRLAVRERDNKKEGFSSLILHPSSFVLALVIDGEM